MAYRSRFGIPLGLVAVAAACGEPNAGAPCPDPSGEFPPTHCAYVEGRLTAAGAPVPGAGLRVADLVPPIGYAYASDAAATDARGRFTLLVLRLNQIQPPSVPDTATVYVKLYPSVAAAGLGAATTDSVAVLLTFAPMGTAVDTSRVELTLP